MLFLNVLKKKVIKQYYVNQDLLVASIINNSVTIKQENYPNFFTSQLKKVLKSLLFEDID